MSSSVIKWHGGKHYLARRIIDLFPTGDRYLHYVEPYCGGCAVLLEHNPINHSEVINDLCKELTTFWTVLQSDVYYSEFIRVLQATPFSQTEYTRAIYNDNDDTDIVSQAVAFFVACRQSRAGCFKDFATLTRNRTRRGMNEQASAWWAAIDGLESVYNRLKRVVILNQPALTVINSQDGPQTLFYLDPPYYPDSRTSTGQYGKYEMNHTDHDALLKRLTYIRGRFVLSGYHCKLYDEYADKFKWHCTEISIANHAAGGSTKQIMTECIWRNFAL